MLVTFTSTHTGELLMLSDLARRLLTAIGKTCSAQGVITAEEVPCALERLQQLVATATHQPETLTKADDAEDDWQPALAARAWPFVEMLKGTTPRHGEEAHILWRAAADF